MRFQPGVSGNPSGRPKKTKEQIEFEARCQKLLSKEGWKWLLSVFKSGKPYQKQWAFEILMDRGFGRAETIAYANVESTGPAVKSPEAIIAAARDLGINIEPEKLPKSLRGP